MIDHTTLGIGLLLLLAFGAGHGVGWLRRDRKSRRRLGLYDYP